MLAYIKGTLQYKGTDSIIVETNGIGYRINTSFSTLKSLGEVEDNVKLYTYLYVREDLISLYGFSTEEELAMFELLLGVSGVGPKAAVSIASTLTPSQFSLAVVTNDINTLTKAQGIGKKTAQRIVLELKDKIKKEQLTLADGTEGEDLHDSDMDTAASEAVSALMVLGYTSMEAYRAVAAVRTENSELEEIIKGALEVLAKHR